nr:hypothetical protein [Tanacetum cinerariifolium]
MTIKSSVKDKILAAQGEASKVENAPAEMLRGMDQQMEIKEDGETIDKVLLIKERIKEVRDHQKSYADNRRKPLEFEVGDQVLLKVLHWKCVVRFGKKSKLAPRYVEPFEILEPVEIMDREVKKLKRSRIPIVNVRWNSKRGLEFTCEREDFMKTKYPQSFSESVVDGSTS